MLMLIAGPGRRELEEWLPAGTHRTKYITTGAVARVDVGKSIGTALGCVLTALTLLVSMGCEHRWQGDSADLVGRYQKEFYNGWEDLRLNADGTYDETYRYKRLEYDGNVRFVEAAYHNSGRWQLVVDGDGPHVLLERAIVFPLFQPPLHIDWRLKVRGTGRKIALDAQDPDNVVFLTKAD